MSLRNIGIVYRKELKDSLRDRRTLISMVVVPILIMPLLTIGIGVVSSQMVGSALKEKSRVMILGGANSPKVMSALETSQEISVVPAAPNYADLISDKKLRAAVEIPADFDARVARGEKVSVKVYDYKGDLKSGIAMEKVQKIFNGMRDDTVRQRLEAHNLPGSLIEPFAIDEENVVLARKSCGGDRGRIPAVLHHYFVSDRSDVSGNGSDCRRERTRHDRDYSLQPRIARASGAGKISDGIHRFSLHGDTGADFDGSVIPFRKSNAGDDAFEWRRRWS